jgi:hypothetical protein
MINAPIYAADRLGKHRFLGKGVGIIWAYPHRINQDRIPYLLRLFMVSNQVSTIYIRLLAFCSLEREIHDCS